MIRIAEVKVEPVTGYDHSLKAYNRYLDSALDRTAAITVGSGGARPLDQAARAALYYQGEDIAEGPTRMVGNAAALADLGWLVGDVGTIEQLDALGMGKHPLSARQLVHTGGRGTRTAYWDMVLSMDKSISDEYAAIDETHRARMLEALRLSVQDMLRAMEEQLTLGVRGHDGAQREHVQLVAALNIHSASRPVEGQDVPDPHLHAHVRVFNAARRADDTWGAISTRSRQIYQAVQAIDAIAQGTFSYHLRRLGWEPKVREITGARHIWPTVVLGHVPGSLMEHHSSRERQIEVLVQKEWARRLKRMRAAILRHLDGQTLADPPRGFEALIQAMGEVARDERGQALLSDRQENLIRQRTRPSRKQREAISRDSRQAKIRGLTVERILEKWQADSAEHGHTPVDAVPLDEEARGALEQRLEASRSRLVEDALSHGEEPSRLMPGLTSAESVFLDQEIFLALAQAGEREGLRYEMTSSAISDVRSRAMHLVPGVHTTQEMWDLEHDLLEMGASLRREARLAVSIDDIDRAVASVEAEQPDHGEPIRIRGTEQEAALRWLCEPPGLRTLIGYPGTGKTTTLRAFARALELAGYRPIVLALAGGAAEVVKAETGALGWNVAEFLTRHQLGMLKDRDGRPTQIGDRDVVIIDENGVVDSRTQAHLMRVLTAAGVAAIRGVGDPEQNQPVLAGGQFRWLSRGELELTQIRRQVNAWETDAVLDWREGRAFEAYQAYDEHGHLNVALSLEEAIEDSAVRLAERVVAGADPAQTVVVADLNSVVANANLAVREQLAARGYYGERRVQDGAGREFAVGDRVLFIQKHAYVTPRCDSAGNVLLDRGGRPRRRFDRIPKRTRGQVVGLDEPNGDLVVRTDAGGAIPAREVTVRNRDLHRLDFGWAINNFGAQARTWDVTYRIDTSSRIAGRQTAMVGGSRAREGTWIWLNAESVTQPSEEAVEVPRAEVIRRYAALASRDRAKSTTLDYDPTFAAERQVWRMAGNPTVGLSAKLGSAATPDQLALLTRLRVGDLPGDLTWVQASLTIDEALGHPPGGQARQWLVGQGLPGPEAEVLIRAEIRRHQDLAKANSTRKAASEGGDPELVRRFVQASALVGERDPQRLLQELGQQAASAGLSVRRAVEFYERWAVDAHDAGRAAAAAGAIADRVRSAITQTRVSQKEGLRAEGNAPERIQDLAARRRTGRLSESEGRELQTLLAEARHQRMGSEKAPIRDRRREESSQGEGRRRRQD